ncbi:hypothetical protein FDUTEX481_02374 [Tolypothrix sp. PCC 7601]|nr:hypothetical protein FDUTEX481_02374 [Tolypothrix sp. PCC 7601]
MSPVMSLLLHKNLQFKSQRSYSIILNFKLLLLAYTSNALGK